MLRPSQLMRLLTVALWCLLVSGCVTEGDKSESVAESFAGGRFLGDASQGGVGGARRRVLRRGATFRAERSRRSRPYPAVWERRKQCRGNCERWSDLYPEFRRCRRPGVRARGFRRGVEAACHRRPRCQRPHHGQKRRGRHARSRSVADPWCARRPGGKSQAGGWRLEGGRSGFRLRPNQFRAGRLQDHPPSLHRRGTGTHGLAALRRRRVSAGRPRRRPPPAHDGHSRRSRPVRAGPRNPRRRSTERALLCPSAARDRLLPKRCQRTQSDVREQFAPHSAPFPSNA